jgi:DNA adenine methylase
VDSLNVSSVPFRSPFRFPGGKTWLVPHIRQWLAHDIRGRIDFVEPFVGGAIVALTVAAEQLARRVIMVEKDPEIAAVWQTVLGGEAQWLADRIVDFRLTSESLRGVLGRRPKSTREIAFQTILRNRTFRGGILAARSSPLRNGERGRGILSRWYPQTLGERILSIARIADRISFIWGDGVEVIRRNAHRKTVVFFIDPPYTVGGKKAGARLYTHSEIDHEELFDLASKVVGDVLMTYDDTSQVRALAKQYALDVAPVVMKNTHHAQLRELLIGRDLGWARGMHRSAPGRSDHDRG